MVSYERKFGQSINKPLVCFDKLDDAMKQNWNFSGNTKSCSDIYKQIFKQRLNEGFIFLSLMDKTLWDGSSFIKIIDGRKKKLIQEKNKTIRA